MEYLFIPNSRLCVRNLLISDLNDFHVYRSNAGCKPTSNSAHRMDDKTIETAGQVSASDTTPKVTGIGGIFFFSDDVVKTKQWYGENLGLEINEWGS